MEAEVLPTRNGWQTGLHAQKPYMVLLIITGNSWIIAHWDPLSFWWGWKVEIYPNSYWSIWLIILPKNCIDHICLTKLQICVIVITSSLLPGQEELSLDWTSHFSWLNVYYKFMMINLKHFFQYLSAILFYFFSSFTLSFSTTLSLFSEQMQHYLLLLSSIFHGGLDSKSICTKCGSPGFDPWVRKILWRRKWQPTPILLPGKSHGWRSLVGYNPWGCKESDTTEWLHFLSCFLSFLLSSQFSHSTPYPFSQIEECLFWFLNQLLQGTLLNISSFLIGHI